MELTKATCDAIGCFAVQLQIGQAFNIRILTITVYVFQTHPGLIFAYLPAVFTHQVRRQFRRFGQAKA